MPPGPTPTGSTNGRTLAKALTRDIGRPAGHPLAAMIFRRLGRFWALRPGRMPAFQPSTYSAVYLWPCPAGTPVANGRSAVTSQKLTNGIQNMLLSTSLPGGSLIQSGSLKIRCGLHQTIGSGGGIRYRIRLPDHGWLAGGIPVVGSFANRTIRPSWYTGWTSGLPGSRWSLN